MQGKVYYMSNGAVSPANRKYSTTGHDYRINFNEKTVVQEAPSEVRMHDAVSLCSVSVVQSRSKGITQHVSARAVLIRECYPISR